MRFSEIKNPQWANAEKTLIDCEVTFDHIGVPVTFTANPLDTEAHGRLIFAMCSTGECGAVADYVPPPPPPVIVVPPTNETGKPMPTQTQPTMIGAQTL